MCLLSLSVSKLIQSGGKGYLTNRQKRLNIEGFCERFCSVRVKPKGGPGFYTRIRIKEGWCRSPIPSCIPEIFQIASRSHKASQGSGWVVSKRGVTCTASGIYSPDHAHICGCSGDAFLALLGSALTRIVLYDCKKAPMCFQKNCETFSSMEPKIENFT